MESNWFKISGRVFLFSFALNFIWENLHSVLYVSNTLGINNHFLLMLYASFIDAFFITAVFLLLVLINKSYYWKLNKLNLVIFSLILFAVSFVIEKRAILTNRWVYSDSMPILLGVGVSPLVQLAVTGLLTLIMSRNITKTTYFSKWMSFLSIQKSQNKPHTLVCGKTQRLFDIKTAGF